MRTSARVSQPSLSASIQQLPGKEPDTVRDDDVLPDQGPGGASSLEPTASGEPDNSLGTAGTDPERGQEDPLLQEDTVSGEEEDFLSERTLHDETQHAMDVPTLEEAVAHTDLGEMPTREETGDRNDPTDPGGSQLSQFDPEDLDH